jgi:phospholipid/cholesterol/gamma-HCH transport system substrate-binding protein
MAKKLELELKVGLFVTIGVSLVLVAILVLGNTESLLSRRNHYTSHLASAEGLITGAKVVLGGIPVGTVESLHFDGEHHDVEAKFSVDRDSGKWVRSDSTIEILTQGMLGDKFVSLNAGSADQAEIPNGGDIPYRASKDLSQFLTKGDQLLLSLNSIATDLDRVLHAFERDNRAETFFQGMAQTSHNFASMSEKLNKQMDNMPMKTAVRNLNEILEKINDGTGTIGALVNDSALYDNVKSLVGGANRNRILRNLVRQTVEGGMENEANQAAPATPTVQKKK